MSREPIGFHSALAEQISIYSMAGDWMNVMRDWHQPVGEQLEIAHREHQERMRLLYPDLFEDRGEHDQWGYDEPDEYLSVADTEESRVDFDASCTNDEDCNHCGCYDCDFVDNLSNHDFTLNEESDIDDE